MTDIPQVKYCNKNSIDFLAYNTGHGSTATLGNFSGIQINLNKLTQATIEPDGESAWVQGGSIAGPLNAYLWEQGYVATTGACDCVGLAGSGLGGGHGRLQGPYGLVSDNVRQFNLVLADGSAVRVNATSHADLYWALRGAGHNFGIVTSMEMSIFPRGPSTWFWKNYVWAGEQLDAIFTAINTMHAGGKAPVNMTTSNGNFMYDPTLNKTHPVISWQFAFRGTEEDAGPYFAPFDAITALSSDSGELPYPEIAHAQNVGLDDPSCSGTLDRIITTASLDTFDITAEHKIFDSFTKRIAENTSLAESTFIIHESYSTQAVDSIPSADSAYPFRRDYHLTQFQGNLANNATSQDEDWMWEWAHEVDDLWNTGRPDNRVDAYVNYANGFEGVKHWYGSEEWRLEKLYRLKAQYDPSNRFRFYNPLVAS